MQLNSELIRLNENPTTKDEAIRMAGQLLVDHGFVTPEYIDSMLKRNEDVSTYMGNFIAIPHGTEDGKKFIKKTGVSVVQVPYGVDFSNDNQEQLVTVVFGIAGLENEHLELLSKIAMYCSEVGNVAKLADAASEQEVIELLGKVG